MRVFVYKEFCVNLYLNKERSNKYEFYLFVFLLYNLVS